MPIGGPHPTRATNCKSHPSDGPLDSLTEDLLKGEDLGLKDLERIVGGEVAAVHTHTHHLHPNEPRVGLQEIPDAQIRASSKDAGPA